MDRYLVVVDQLRTTIDELAEVKIMLHEKQNKTKQLEELLSNISNIALSFKQPEAQTNKPEVENEHESESPEGVYQQGHS